MTHSIVPARIYLWVLVALLLLTAATVATSFLDFGGGRLHFANAILAFTIAISKATLVVLYFMHARYGSRLTWVFVAAGFLWLLILIALILSDVLTRYWLPDSPPWGLG